MQYLKMINFLKIKLKKKVFFAFFFGTLILNGTANAEPYIGEVACGGWNFCPNGWAECNGQLVPISENGALFSVIGTTYGGDGQTNFALPNLASRLMVHAGQGPGRTNRVMGEQGGTETVTLSASQIPTHTHAVVAHAGAEKSASPTNRIPGIAPASRPLYGPIANADTTLSVNALSSSGGSQPHNNLQPYLVVKCCIALYGLYPTQ